jgi:hypothetical protein
MRPAMPTCRVHLHGAMFAVLLLGGVSGCSATASVRAGGSTETPDQATWTAQARARAAEQAQRPGTCQVAPPQIKVPAGEWTATQTILSTNAVDACAGERLVRPWDFRRRCHAGHCKTYLYSVSYYRVVVAQVVPAGQGRYLATFAPGTVPCPHRPGEDAGTSQNHGTITIWWSPDKLTLYGMGRDYQVGACGGGPPETSRWEARRTNPAAKPPAEGP